MKDIKSYILESSQDVDLNEMYDILCQGIKDGELNDEWTAKLVNIEKKAFDNKFITEFWYDDHKKMSYFSVENTDGVLFSMYYYKEHDDSIVAEEKEKNLDDYSIKRIMLKLGFKKSDDKYIIKKK